MANYPTQLDEIDQWLFDSFGIVAGACSSTENLRYNTARTIAEVLWPEEQDFTHHETNESLQEAVTHQMEDDQTIDDYVRKGLDEVCLRYAELGAKWGAEHRDRFLNWIRDLIKAGIEKPEEALNILKRIDTLINDNSLWAEHLKK